jgi:hypothetical protein
MTSMKILNYQRQIQIHCCAILLPPHHCMTCTRDVQACFCRHSLSPCPQLAKTLETTSVSTTCSRLIVNVFIHNIDEFKKLKTHQSCNAALKPTHVCTRRPNIPHIDIQQHHTKQHSVVINTGNFNNGKYCNQCNTYNKKINRTSTKRKGNVHSTYSGTYHRWG